MNECTEYVRSKISGRLEPGSSNTFTGRNELRAIWQQAQRTLVDGGLESESNPSILRIILIDEEECTLLIIATILVLINWEDWDRFAFLFVLDGDLPRYDLPLPPGVARKLLPKHGMLFEHHQSHFLAPTIREGDNVVLKPPYSLPLKEPEMPVEEGAYGCVTRMVIAEGYFRWKDPYGISRDPVVLAKKTFFNMQDFRDEIKQLNALRDSETSHKAILWHLCTLEVGRDVSILSKYADGGNLDHFLHGKQLNGQDHWAADNTVLSWTDILSQALQVASALEFLHNHRTFRDSGRGPVYHSDLKPSNVVIVRGEGCPAGIWMLTDFGLSVLHRPRGYPASTTASWYSGTEARRGTGTFQAPETDPQFFSYSGNISSKADIWSYGAILCLILAFMMHGHQGVHLLDGRRTRSASGRPEDDFFYTLTGLQEDRKDAILKPSIDQWLNNIHNNPESPTWAKKLTKIIRTCLDILAPRRDPASKLCDSIRGLLYEEHIGASAALEASATQRSMSTAPAVDEHRFFSPERRHQTDPVRMAPDSFQRTASWAHDLPVATQGRSMGSENSDIQVPSKASSTPSTIAFRGLPVEDRHQITSPRLFHLDKAGEYLLISFKASTYLWRNTPGGTESTDFVGRNIIDPKHVHGSLRYAFALGSYMALFPGDGAEMSTQLIPEKADDEMYASIQRAHLDQISDTAVSNQEEVVLMDSRKLQLVRPSAPSIPTYDLTHSFPMERFRAIQFDRQRRNLWAIGTKRWFKFPAEAIGDSFCEPASGDIQLPRDHRDPSVFMFSLGSRDSFLWYEAKSEMLRLYETSKPYIPPSVRIPMTCGQLCAGDRHFFYVSAVRHRLRKTRWTLCCRIIFEGEIRDEHHVKDLDIDMKDGKYGESMQMALRRYPNIDGNGTAYSYELIIATASGKFCVIESPCSLVDARTDLH